MNDLFSLYGFVFDKPKEVRPVLTVDLASDIPTERFIRALADAGLTIVEQPGRKRLMICQARKPSEGGYEFVQIGGKKKKAKAPRHSN